MGRSISFSGFSFFLFIALSTPHAFTENHPQTEKVVQSNTQLAIDLYDKIEIEEGNVFFSPYSISTAHAFTYGGARGETAKQMAAVLHLSLENEELHSAFADIQSRLNAIPQEEKTQLHIANSLWPREMYPYLKEYLEFARKYYRSEINPVDYKANPEDARQKVNIWIEEKTNNKIKDIMPEPPDPETRLILANAVYCKGEWVSRFKESATKEMPFYLNENESIEVPRMHQTCDLNYGEDEILVESIKEWSKKLRERPVAVYLPRSKMTFQFDLKKVLISMGMKDALIIGKADFSGMDGKPNWLYIGFALHKAFLDVNEEGTEAAAATFGGGFFPAATEVLTFSGPRAIEMVKPGTEVYACDLSSGDWGRAKVLKRQSHQYEGDMIAIQTGHITIHTTGTHPFYVLRGERLAFRPQPRDVQKEEQGEIEGGPVG
jgi:serpin B